MRKHTTHAKWRNPLVFLLLLLFQTTVLGQVVPPVASVSGGRFTASFTVSLATTTPDAVLRYTLDGSSPDSLLSPQYINPLTIDKTTVLRVKAFAAGQMGSAITTHTYFFNVNHTFPIVAISFNNGDFFNDTTGIYTKYTNGLEVPVNIELLEPNGTTAVFSQYMGLDIQGSASASLPQKSFELKPKKAYGLDNIPYKMFSDLPYTSYKRLVLRNNGQDWGVSMFRDDMISSLAMKLDDLNGIVKKPEMHLSSYRPAVVYLNGQYWGVYSIKERMKTAFVEQHFNIKPTSYDMTENETERLNGDSLAWDGFYKEINSSNYTDNAAFETLKDKIDVQNFLDYNAFNVYIDNEDWPGNNVRRFKANSIDGKWRWISYDFDFSMGLFQVTGGFNTGDATPNSIKRLLDPSIVYFNNPYWGTLLFRRCMENANFRRDFINRSADMMNTIFKADRVNQRIEEFRTQYAPEVPSHTKRWGSPQPSLWIANLDKLKSFATNRKTNFIKHVDDQFAEVTGTAEVTLNVSPAQAGSINFSTLTVKNSGWTGTYFKGIDIPVKAVANTGYVFSRWEGKTLPATDSVGVNLTENTVLTAIFTPIDNVDTCLTDVAPPTLQGCPNNIILSTTATCATTTWVAPTATDNCTTTPSVSSDFASGNCFPIGTTKVTYTAKDSKNNASTCSFDVIVSLTPVDPCASDIVPPVLQNCPSNITLTTTTTCATATWTAPTATDNCTTATVSSNFNSGTCFPIGNTTVTYTAIDAKNNSSKCDFTVAVVQADLCATDTIKPALLNCPSDIILTTTTTCAAATWVAPTATDNCSTPTVSSNFNSGNCFPIGTTVVTYTATDVKNNISTCSFNVTVSQIDICATDTIKPILKNCPNNILLSTTSTCAVATWVAPTATDNCSTPTVSSNFNSGNCFPIGTTTVTYTATDIKNNSAICSFNIVVNSIDPCLTDTVKPILQNCPSNILISTATTCAAVTWIAPTATDNCGTPSVSSNFNSGACLPIGTTTVTYTATDAKNNSTTCNFNVVVTLNDPCATDITKPSLQNCPGNIVLTTTSNCTAATWTAPTATDNCSTPLLTSNFNSGACFPMGISTVTYEAVDAKNNKAACSFTVTVTSAAQPCVRVKGSIQREVWTGISGYTITDLTSNAKFLAAPNRKTSLTELKVPYQEVEVNYGDRIRGFIYPPTSGTYTFYIYGDDQASLYLNKTGNTAAAKERIAYNTSWTNEAQITKQTTQKSTSITLVAGKEYYIEVLHKQSGGGDHVGVMWTLPGTTTAAVIKGQYLAPYDSCQTAPVNVCDTDTQAPVIQNCPSGATITISSTCATATWTAPTATDNCATPSLVSNYPSGYCFPIGTTTVTYTAKDVKNNTSTCSFSIVVTANTIDPCATDAVKPTFQNCPSNQTLTTTSICAVANWTAPTATDNCGTPSVSSNFQSGACFPIGTTAVVYTATDAKNNTSNCSFNIVVTESIDPCAKDTIKPIISACPSNISLTTTNTCAVATWATPTATDNCSTPTVSSNFQSGACFPIGTTTVVYTATDAKANSSQCSFNVSVQAQTVISNDIALSITSSAPIYKKYSTITFTITANNTSAVAMSNVKIEFPYPAGTVNGGTATPSVGTWVPYCSGGVLCYNWTIPSLPANSSATLSVPLYVLNIATPIVATTKLLISTPLDDNAANNQASITVASQVLPAQNLNKNNLKPTQLVPLVVQSIYPNPTDSELSLELESLLTKQIAFYISNSLGQVVKTEYRDVEKGVNKLHFNISDMKGGIYMIVPETNIGMSVPTKFVKL